MNIFLLSDLHLEVIKEINISELISKFGFSKTENSIFVLAGDIGDPRSEVYTQFVLEMSKLYDQVLIILGNHDYYRYSLQETLEYIKDLKIAENVHFLNQSYFFYRGIKFIGCTLWTNSDEKLINRMHDYTNITDFTSEMCNNLHKQHVKWLENELNVHYDGQIVVITHHLPSKTLIDSQYIGDERNIFYADDLEYLMEKADIWLCGHTHIGLQKTIGKCKCYVNPVGYMDEETIYNKNLKIPVKSSIKVLNLTSLDNKIYSVKFDVFSSGS